MIASLAYGSPIFAIHWSCSFLYPLQCTKNCVPHPYFLWFLISSTLYSSSSLMISGGGTGSMYCLLKYGSLHHVNRSSLNMLWIIYPSGNSIWNASWPIFFEILKGLYLFWSNFFKGHFEWIFLAPSHTLSLTFNPCRFLLFLSNCFFIASFAISIDVLALSQLLCNPSRKSFSFGNSVFIVRFPFPWVFSKIKFE